MKWFFGFAEVNGEWTTAEPRELESPEQADEIGAWPGLFTAGPYASEDAARARMAEMHPDVILMSVFRVLMWEEVRYAE